MSKVTDLFTEKFRPKNLNQLIVPERIKTELSKGLIQNLLFYGSPGIGKSSAQFILSQNHTTLYINAAAERGIDTVREKITNFCSTLSLDGGKENLKCVILDEADCAVENFYLSLSATQERFAHNARFIASCNNIHKIPEKIQSRFKLINFDPINTEEEQYIKQEYKKRIILILDAVKISYTDETLSKFIDNDFPDMRTLMNKLQSFYLREIKELNPSDFNINFDYKDLFELCLCKPDPINNYKFIINEYSSRIDETFTVLGRDFIEYLKTNYPQKTDKIPLLLIALADYQYQKQFVIDPLITLLACCFKIQQILQ